jgi:hypothetical protein
MEGLIIAIVLGIITSLFNKGKKEDTKKPTKQMPPFSSQPAPRQQKEVRPAQQQNPRKSLEDFANEVFGQLNEKAKPVDQKIETVTPIQVEKPIQRQPQQVVEQNTRSQSTNANRVLTERPIVQKLKQQSEALQVVPSNQRELMQAIVMSEILGPPKSKQR